MTRTRFQPGPETGHYHDKLGVNEDSGGGGFISATDGTTTVNPATSIVFPSGTLSDLGSGVAGVGLILLLVGPYRVTYDQLPDSVPLTVTTIPAGSIILRATAIVRTSWTVDNSSGRLLALDLGSTNPAHLGTFWCDDDNGSAWPTSDPYANEVQRTDAMRPVGRWTISQVPLPLTVQMQAVIPATSPTTGAADIYAIIATPAS